MFYQIWTTPVSFPFTEWSLEALGCTTDFASISCSDLDQRLGKWYAINRQFQDLGRDIGIVRVKEFRGSNNILEGKLKKNLQNGLDRPTNTKKS